ncbi:uncharacterized protein LOC135493704 [Lineus longissimus]|uniref:uncharacterized protein LOC135493704 n=1 Tax=Lineus longissimus TaxID=88925 RepID=UPI00315DF8CF
MHDLLRSLPAEKKRRWPQHLPELVFAYNAAPHQSTGYSPYFLFFGHDPRLPIDQLLPSVEDTDHQVDYDEWITLHHTRMKEAQVLARTRLEKEALKRERLRPVKEDKLEVGSRVFLKNLGVRGRNKMQDRWNSVPYQVIGKPDPNNEVYSVEPLDGSGPAKTMNRVNLLRSDRLVVQELPEQPDEEQATDRPDPIMTRSRAEARDNQVAESDRSESDSEDDDIVVWEEPGEVLEAPPQVEISIPVPAPTPRRSGRATAGRHRNMHHLPKSSVHTTVREMTEINSDSGTSMSEQTIADFAKAQLMLAKLLLRN